MYLEVKNVKKSYGEGGSFAQVLKGISISVNRGDLCVIQGTSGSGKSTLLNCIGGLDLMDSGSIQVDGKEIASCHRNNYLITGERISVLFFSFIIWCQILPSGKIFRCASI